MYRGRFTLCNVALAIRLGLAVLGDGAGFRSRLNGISRVGKERCSGSGSGLGFIFMIFFLVLQVCFSIPRMGDAFKTNSVIFYKNCDAFMEKNGVVFTHREKKLAMHL